MIIRLIDPFIFIEQESEHILLSILGRILNFDFADDGGDHSSALAIDHNEYNWRSFYLWKGIGLLQKTAYGRFGDYGDDWQLIADAPSPDVLDEAVAAIT